MYRECYYNDKHGPLPAKTVFWPGGPVSVPVIRLDPNVPPAKFLLQLRCPCSKLKNTKNSCHVCSIVMFVLFPFQCVFYVEIHLGQSVSPIFPFGLSLSFVCV